VALRIIDLRCDWLRQYASETSLDNTPRADEVLRGVARLDGYLTGTTAAVLVCHRSADDWARRPERWRSLNELITRYESEFAGRLLIGPDDVARWHDEGPDGLCWGMLGVAGFDALIRSPEDLDHLAGLFERGVRVFQPVESGSSVLAGSAHPGDDRGLSELGRSFLARLAELPGGGAECPRPIVDLAGLNSRSMAEVIKFGTEGALTGRLLFFYSHGALSREGSAAPGALSDDNLVALRAVGGVIGLTAAQPFHLTPDDFKAAINRAAAVPFDGRAGYEGIAFGTDLLGVEQTFSGLGNVVEIRKWISREFNRATAALLLAANARRILLGAAGGESVWRSTIRGDTA
jgi:membrane dipeptidase